MLLLSVATNAFPEGTQRIEMADARTNYVPTDNSPTTDLRTSQQLGQLALKGVRLEDRRDANVMQHRMTGRPLQLDFGIAGKVSGEDQALVLAQATQEGMKAAGLGGPWRTYCMQLLVTWLLAVM